MNTWLNSNADGLAFALWIAVLGLLFVLVAVVVEWAEVRAMRRRARQREALRRYTESIIGRCWQGPSA